MANWHNWVDSQKSDAEVRTPTTLEQLRSAVLSAGRSGRRIRPAGASYSWAPLIPIHDGMIIDMSKMTKMLSIDTRAKTVEVEAGTNIKKLNDETAKHGMTLISPPLFPGPTVGGALATGSHGTTFLNGGFSDQVVELTIMRADGELVTVKKPDPANPQPHDDDYYAAIVSLGTLGIIYSAKLQLDDQYNVRTELRQINTNEVLEGFDDLAHRRSCDFLEIFHSPLQETMWVYLMNKTDSHPDPVTFMDEVGTQLKTLASDAMVTYLLPWLSNNTPELVPHFYPIANASFSTPGVSVATASEAFHFEKAYPKAWDMSYAFDRKDAERAWRAGIELIEDYAAAGQYPINLVMHCRFTKASDAWIAPDHGRETVYVELTTAYGTENFEQIFKDLEKR